MHISLVTAQSIADAVDQLGGAVPDTIARLLAMEDARRTTKLEPITLAADWDAGTLTPENYAERLRAASIDYAAREVANKAGDALRYHLEQELIAKRQTIADQIVESLKPATTEPLATLRAAREAGITSVTTADHMIDADDETRKLWIACGPACSTLDSIHRQVVVPILVEMDVLGTVHTPGGPAAQAYRLWSVTPLSAPAMSAGRKWIDAANLVRLITPSAARDEADGAMQVEEWTTEWAEKELARRTLEGERLKAEGGRR